MTDTKQKRNQQTATPRPHRARRTVRLADSLSGLTRSLIVRQGFAQSDVVTHWRSIAGSVLAGHCLPEKLTFPRGERRGGTLHLMVDNAFALEIQHLAPELIARINSYYGFEAVSHIRITQGPVARPTRPRRRPAPLSADDNAAIADAAATARDKDLRHSLEALGRAVYTTGSDS
ncbi:MAG: DUF721 domain-containing protein [Sphingomonadales bacterium]